MKKKVKKNGGAVSTAFCFFFLEKKLHIVTIAIDSVLDKNIKFYIFS